MTDEDDLPPFSLPPDDVAIIAARVLAMPEHEHLTANEVPIGYLMRNDPKHKGNKVELGSVHEVKSMFQGGFKELGLQLLAGLLGELPAYLVVLNAPWWDAASAMEKEALVFHELAHIQQAIDRYGAPKFDRDGLPVFKCVEHDIGEFNSVVARYGHWTPDISNFINAARSA